MLYGEVVAKCWEDEAYKKRFVEDPESVLAEAGIRESNLQGKRFVSKVDTSDKILPEGTEVRIIQNTEDMRYLVLPASPKSLTQAELKSIFGGDGSPIWLRPKLHLSNTEFMSMRY